MDPTKTILYARFSSVGQKTGTSLERQLDEGAAYCRTEGWQVDAHMTDEGRSAFHGHHRSKGNLGVFEQDALAGLEGGTRLVCENLDRLSREDVKKSFAFINGLLDAGITIVTYHDGRTYDASVDMVDLIVILTTLHRGNGESVAKSKRSKSNWKIKHQRALTEGKALSKRCKPWLTVVDGRYQTNDRVPLLKRVFMWADAGEGSLVVTKRLNETETPWNGKQWHRSYIIKLLTDRSVVGEHFIGGEWVKLYPPVIDADVFERVSANAAARKSASVGNSKGKVSNLLAGLCCCSTCGAHMQLVTGTLKCRKALVGACSNGAGVRYQPLERAVLDSCLHLALDDNAFTNRAEVARLNVTIAERQRDLSAAQDRARSLMELFVTQQSQLAQTMALEAEQSATALLANLEALKAQREQAKGRASNLEHMKRVTDMRAKLSTDVTLRKRVAQGFQTLIERVQFGADGSVSVFFIAGAAVLRYVDGQLVSAFDLVKDGRENVPELAAYAARRDKAKQTGKLFGERAASK